MLYQVIAVNIFLYLVAGSVGFGAKVAAPILPNVFHPNEFSEF